MAQRAASSAAENVEKTARKVDRLTAELVAARDAQYRAAVELEAAEIELKAANEALAVLHGTPTPHETIEAPAGHARVGVEGNNV
jgi:hypothetical protein